MVTTLEQLYSEHRNTFKLKLLAGRLHGQNLVDWIYMLEDETILPYIQGGSLIVTTGARQVRNEHWLRELVEELIRVRASGLVVNTGKYIRTIPQDIISLCTEHNFALITMPWEMRITEMTQTLCMTIINNQQENLLHDRAMYEAILHPENVEDYWERLGVYYDLKGDFTIAAVYARDLEGDVEDIFLPPRDMEYRLERKLKGLIQRPAELRISWIQMEWLQVFIINRKEKDTVEKVVRVLQEVYQQIRSTHRVSIGIGTTEQGGRGISESYRNALAALRMAERKEEPEAAVSFRDMGVHRLLLSCRNDEIPKRYADELLAPIDAMGTKSKDYLQFLDAYIRHDRSLEGTAEELFLHRNTVNYRVNKLRDMLGSPLKTAEDLFPYRLALNIRVLDMSGS